MELMPRLISRYLIYKYVVFLRIDFKKVSVAHKWIPSEMKFQIDLCSSTFNYNYLFDFYFCKFHWRTILSFSVWF